ncbi:MULTISPECIES: hypothetical protein [unclassified Pseudomonas]|nr:MULTISPECIES: hypothetical protein [unclassified Pseudomonas]WIE48226.1 hypothetical protein PMI20_021010 [Pseudomonas sp. GM17]
MNAEEPVHAVGQRPLTTDNGETGLFERHSLSFTDRDNRRWPS